MIVRRYQGSSEEEAIAKAQQELGSSAVVLLSKKFEGGGSGARHEVVVAVSLAAEETGSDDWTDRSLSHVDHGQAPQRRRGTPSAPTSPAALSEQSPSAAPTGPDASGAGTQEGVTAAWVSQVRREIGREAYTRERASHIHDVDPSVTPLVHMLREVLRSQDVDEAFLESLLASIRRETGDSANGDARTAAVALARAMDRHMRVADPSPNRLETRTIALVGPTGVGKTTTIAKLAARFLFGEGRRVVLVTADTDRIAGDAQLRTYGRIFQVPVERARTAAEMRDVVRRHDRDALFLFDAPGRNPQDRGHVAEMAEIVDVAGPRELYLAVSCTTRSGDLWQIARGFHDLRPDGLVLTKVDETGTFGPVLSFAHHLGIPIAYLTTGQTVPDTLEEASLERIVDLLLKRRQSVYC